MKRSGWWVLIFVALFSVVGLLAIFFWADRSPKQATQDRIVINQAAKTLLYLPLYVAIDKGYFSDEGLSVTVNTGGGDSQAFAALIGGSAQFAQGDPTFVAISHEKGGPGRVIAAVLNRASFWGVAFSDKLQPITNPLQFKGLRVVTYPCPNTACVLQKRLVEQAGLRLGEDTWMIAASFGTEFGPLERGAADVAMSIEPAISQAAARGGRVVFSYADSWGPFLLTGLMTTETYIAENPKVVQGVVVAYERALRFIHTNPLGAAEVGARQFPEVGADVIRTAIGRMTGERVFPEHAAVEEKAWRSALQVRIDLADLKAMPTAQLIDNSFAEAAQKRVGTGPAPLPSSR